jgi:prepilin-type N-terminal cleavage/methylation domain-containing protein
MIRHREPPPRSSAGFTLTELMIAMSVLMIVSAGVMNGITQMARTNRTVVNRSDMHAGVRNATELLEQEVGQAGRVALPGRVTTTAAVGIGPATVTLASTAAGSATAGMFVGERLTVGTGDLEEIVTVSAINGNQITAAFEGAHAANTVVGVTGGFAAGVVPTTMANGSTGSVLKILGDINHDGRMVYVEYRCDLNAGRLYRNAMAFDAAAKPAVTIEQVLLDNVLANPDGTSCFTYQQKTALGNTYTVGVAITLTVRTQDRDQVTNGFQTETKALLNVSPRNVFNVWQMASLNETDHVQPIPPPTVTLLAN